MNKIKKLMFVHLSIFMCYQISADDTLQKAHMNTAQIYANAVGAFNMLEEVVTNLNLSCNSNIQIPLKSINEVDFLLRKKSAYKYEEFVALFGNQEEVKILTDATTEQLLTQFANCSPSRLSDWEQSFVMPTLESQLNMLRDAEHLYGLPKIDRNEEDILKAFEVSVNNYKNLPDDEIAELASALESGSYFFTMLTLIQSIRKDNQKALELREYLANQSLDPEALYQLAKTQEKSNKAQALKSYTQSAEMGYKLAEIWLGTYYACHNNKVDAMFWLNKARPKEPDYINDIVLEIEELGQPTNCYEGWVY